MFLNLRTELFSNGVRNGYFEIKYPSDEITGVVQEHTEFKNFKDSVNRKFSNWKTEVYNYLQDINTSTPPKSVIEKLSNTILKAFQDQLLINKYDIYQHLMNYWEEIMQMIFMLSTADDWKSGNEVVRLYKEGKIYRKKKL